MGVQRADVPVELDALVGVLRSERSDRVVAVVPQGEELREIWAVVDGQVLCLVARPGGGGRRLAA